MNNNEKNNNEIRSRLDDFFFMNKELKVYKEGEGAPDYIDNKKGNVPTKQNIEIENRISNLEIKLNKRLSDKKREVVKFIAGINYTHKGFTGDQLSERFKYTPNYAQKLIHELRHEKIIFSTGRRIGHKMTYFLTNMQDYIPLKDSLHKNYFNNRLLEEHSCLNRDIVIILLKEMSRTNGVYHNFRLQTKLLDKRLYERLDITSTNVYNNRDINSKIIIQWKLQSTKNKVKFYKLTLPRYRSATLNVSPNGMVEIYINSSSNPYDLNNDIGLSEFIADLGKIEEIFYLELNSLSSIERIFEWKIVRMEFNKDINLTGYLETSGNTILKVRHLSHLYQFYTKLLPEEGLISRLEEALSTSKPYPTVMEFVSP